MPFRSTTALAGHEGVRATLDLTNDTCFAYMPGEGRNSRFRHFDFNLRRSGLRDRAPESDLRDAPLECSRDRRPPDIRFHAKVIRRRSFSMMLATRRTLVMSTTEMKPALALG